MKDRVRRNAIVKLAGIFALLAAVLITSLAFSAWLS